MAARVTIKLPGVFDIMSIGTVQPALVEMVARGKCVLKGEMVERITTPAIQLLLAADKSLASQNKQLVVQKPSAAMQQAFADLGLSSHLNQWSQV